MFSLKELPFNRFSSKLKRISAVCGLQIKEPRYSDIELNFTESSDRGKKIQTVLRNAHKGKQSQLPFS